MSDADAKLRGAVGQLIARGGDGIAVGWVRVHVHDFQALRHALSAARSAAPTDRRETRDAHAEDWCRRCGGANIVWSADSVEWNLAVPAREVIWCPLCFVSAWEAVTGTTAVWRLLLDPRSDKRLRARTAPAPIPDETKR